ncbi:MAG: hypothetical protein ACLTYN_11265 [Dysosmobacter welbionis]
MAIEIALGAGLQNIVVDQEEDAKAAISYKTAGRRTGHVPALTAIRGDGSMKKAWKNLVLWAWGPGW